MVLRSVGGGESTVFAGYRVLGLVAAGGMASVHLARRVDDEDDERFVARLVALGVERVRLIGAEASIELRRSATQAGIHVADQSVVPDGRIELLHYVREQAVSTTRHRFGNLLPS